MRNYDRTHLLFSYEGAFVLPGMEHYPSCMPTAPRSVVDWKTARSGIFRSMEVQANEYGHLRNEIGIDPAIGRPVEAVGVLRTGSRHRVGYEYKAWDLCQKTHEVFEALLVIGRDFDPQKEPKIYTMPKEITLNA